MKMEEMKLITAVPTYGPVDPRCAQELRVGIMAAATCGVVFMGDASTDRSNYSDARNSSAQFLLESKANGIMWVDSDIRQTIHDMPTLLKSVEDFNSEFVTGVYHQRNWPYDACFYSWSNNRQSFRASATYPANSYAPCDGCGFGFVYTSRRLIEAVANSKNFDPDRGWFPDDRSSAGYGEDLSFCRQVMLLGHPEFQLYVNTSAIVGHLGDVEVIYPDKRKAPQVQLGANDVFHKWGFVNASK
jgi:hypothetical protein